MQADVRTHVLALDGARLVAAALVVLTHAAFLSGAVNSAGLWGHLMGRGDFGVAIFFVLSGYLLHRGLVRDPRSLSTQHLRTYAVRRAARILPAYWLVLAVVAIATGPSARDLLLHALTLQIYVHHSLIPAFSQSWSIATEVSFYAVLPLLALALAAARRRNPDLPVSILTAFLPVGVALTWLASSADLLHDIPYERWLPARSASFALGMLLAEVVARPSHPVSRRLAAWAARPGPVLALGGAAYLLATTPVAGRLTLGTVSGGRLAVKMVLSCVVALAVLLPLVLGGDNPWRRALGHPVCAGLGRISYGIFLWHVPVFTLLYAVSGLEEFSGGLVPLLALGVPLTLLLAALTYVAVERPVIAWAHARGQEQRREAEAPRDPLERGRA